MDVELDIKEILPIYYEKLFPFKHLYKWLRYSDEKFKNREFSYTSNEIYRRHLSYNDEKSFYDSIKKDSPDKIDIGAIYNVPPKHKSQVLKFEPIERELVFDIDANDYDEVRYCSCKGSPSVCQICWKLIVNGVKVIDASLREDFGFKHIFWFFSGRRGVHCWVCDERARLLRQEVRTAIIGYFRLSMTRDESGEILYDVPERCLSSLERAFNILEPYFLSIVKEHNILDNEDLLNTVLKYIPQDHRTKLIEKIQRNQMTSEEKWSLIETLRKEGKISGSVIKRIVFHFTYPRLDEEVSKHLNHLLKSPFVVHPSTGKISVPIDIENIDSFDPDQVPTIYQLEKETRNTNNQENSLAKYVKYFKSLVLKLKIDTSREKSKNGDNSSLQF